MIRSATILALLLPLGAAPAPGEAPQALRVERKVRADVLIRPTALSAPQGSRQPCPNGISKPLTGDTIVLTVADRMARRDQPGLSFIVRLDQRRAYLLFHPDRAFTRLDYPIEKPRSKPPQGWDEKTWREHQEPAQPLKHLALRLLQPLASEPRALGELRAVVSRGVVGNDVRPHLDIEVVHEAGSRPVPETANALEEGFQRLRPGNSWLGLFGQPTGLLLGWAEAVYLPDEKVHYREEFAALAEVPARADLFEPPADYQQVELDGICLLGLDNSREN